MAYVVDHATAKGFIALQVHALQRPEQAGYRTFWRNIRVQTVDLQASPAAAIDVRNMIPQWARRS